MPDYNFIMDSRFRPEQLRVVNQLGRMAASHGLILYLAGASARDLILGLSSGRNLNFVVEGNIQKILRPLSSRAARNAEAASGSGSALGSGELDLRVASLTPDSKLNRAQVIFEGGVGAEIAMSRNEVYGAPGKAPAVSPGSIFDDLRRRDFSIDAMAISLHPNSRGLLLDPTNGAADIERRELRALHSRSFFDEPARIYRLLRLSLRLDFKPDEKTDRWLGMALEERAWEHLSEDQQGRELRAILGEESAGKLLKILKDRELLGGLDRKLAGARIEFDKFDRIRTAMRTANATEEDAVLLNFHALVAKLPGADHDRLAKKILKDSKTVKAALSLEREAGQLAKVLAGAKINKPSQVYTLLSSSPTSLVLFLLVDDTRSTIQNRIKAFFTKYLAVRAGLPRAELQSLGLPPGPKFEKVIDQVFLDELDGKVKSPQQMTKLLMDYAGIKAPPPPPPTPPAKAGTGKSMGAKGQTGKPGTHRVEPVKEKITSAAPLAKPPDAAKPITVKTSAAPQAKAEARTEHKGSRASAKGSKAAAATTAKPAKPARLAKAKAKSQAGGKPRKAPVKKRKPAAGGKRH